MADRGVARLIDAAARCQDIDDFARAVVDFLGDVTVACAAARGVWSRFGGGRWHALATQGPVPPTPPADGGEWQAVRLTSDGRTTVIAVTPPSLSDDERELLRGVLEAALRRLHAQAALEAATYSGDERLAAVLEAAPDAVVVVSLDGTILHANARAVELFGYALEDLVSSPVERLVPVDLRSLHVAHRARYAEAPSHRPMAAGQDLHARHRDGSAIPVDIALAPVDTGGKQAVAAFVRDASTRRRAEAYRREARDAELARRQAFELNDNVVQGLTAAVWLLEIGAADKALTALRKTLTQARQMMTELLRQAETPPGPGELRRRSASPTAAAKAAPPERGEAPARGGIRLVVADDSEDLRFLLSRRLEEVEDMTVVAAVGDGIAALEAAEEHAPDAVLMDLSMPLMDGLEATADLRAAHPGLRIVILTGHASEAMRQQAMAAGADAYVEKGSDFEELLTAVRGEPQPSQP